MGQSATPPVNTCGSTRVVEAFDTGAPFTRNSPARCSVAWLRYTNPILARGLPSALRNGVYIKLALKAPAVSRPLISIGVPTGGRPGPPEERNLVSPRPSPQKLAKV